jgi:hypothetical protein
MVPTLKSGKSEQKSSKGEHAPLTKAEKKPSAIFNEK